MAVKKTVKKRRTSKKTISLETVIETLQSESNLSGVNKRGIARLNKAATLLGRQEKLIDTQNERIGKARDVVAAAKTPAAKEKARARLAAAIAALKEAKQARSAAIAEQKKAERLLRGLHKALDAARAKMIKEFDKAAKSMEKAIDKPPRRRRVRSRKVAVSTDEG